MKTITIIKLAIIAAIIATISVSFKRISNLLDENLKLQNNQALLLSKNNEVMVECRKYKVSDSLNAYKISELRLTLGEYKKYRSEDLALINKLKFDKTDMQKIIDSQAKTIYSLTAKLRDTVVIIDTLKYSMKAFEYKSKWIDVLGQIDLQKESVQLDIHNREELTVVESVEYKRFLGFLWKTKKIKRRDVDIVSKNPNTEIVDVEYISIEN